MKLRHFNYSVFKVKQTPSTNSLLWEMLDIKSYENGFSIIAEAQTKGKGQKGNIWITEPGKNLTFSLVIFPKLETKNVFYLNMMSALAIEKTLLEYDISSQIKWPNDVLINEHKVAGLLIENQIQGQHINKTVIGIGLNVNQSHFPFLRPVTAISQELGRNIEIESVFKQLYQNLDYYFNLLINKDFNLLKKLYLQKLYRFEKWADYSSEAIGAFTGKIIGIEENGKLSILLKDQSKINFDMQTIQFK